MRPTATVRVTRGPRGWHRRRVAADAPSGYPSSGANGRSSVTYVNDDGATVES